MHDHPYTAQLLRQVYISAEFPQEIYWKFLQLIITSLLECPVTGHSRQSLDISGIQLEKVLPNVGTGNTKQTSTLP